MPPVTGQFDNLLKGDEIGRFLGQFVLPDHIRADLEARSPGAALPKNQQDVLRDVKDIWDKKGFLTPAELRAELMDKYLPNSPAALKDFIKDVELSRNHPESVTGYLNKEHAYSATALAHLYATEQGKPIAMVEVDFSNMGGTNDKFREMLTKERGVPVDQVPRKDAEQMTDRAVKLLSDSMANDLARELPPGAKVVPVRTGGDEVRLIFTGVDDPAELKRLQSVIHANIEKHVAGMGLQDHPHLKDPDNPVRNGFGAAVAVQDMRKIDDSKSLIKVLDEEITAEKNKIGARRLGQIDEGLARATIEGQLERGELKVLEGQTREAVVTAEIDRIKAKAKAAAAELHQKNPEHNKSLQGGVKGFNDYVAKAEREMAASPLVTRPAPAVLAADAPAGANRPPNLPTMASIEQRHIAVAEDHLSRQGVQLNSAERHFLGQSASGLTAIDPSAQVLMPKDMAALTNAYAAESQEVQKKFDPAKPETQTALKQAGLKSVQDIKPQGMAVSFHGLASFNSVLGHENADYALRHMGADLIEGSLRQAGIAPAADGTKPYAIAHHGGGNFSVIVQPVVTGADGKQILISPDKMKEVERNIAERLKEFGKTPVAKFLESKGVKVDATLQGDLARKGVTDFNSMPDSKLRTVTHNGNELVGKLQGVHAVTVTTPLVANDNFKGTEFLGGLRTQADRQMDGLREQHVINVGQVKPVVAAPAAPASLVTSSPSPTASPAASTASFQSLKPSQGATSVMGDVTPAGTPVAAKPVTDVKPASDATPAKGGWAAVKEAASSGQISQTARTAAATHVTGNGVGIGMGLYGLSQKLGANGTAAEDLKDEKTRTLAKAGIVSDVAAVTIDSVDTLAKVSRNLNAASKVARVAAPVGVALTVASGAVDYKIAAAKGDGKRAAEAVGGSTGGMVGAIAGGAAGAKAGALAGAAVGVWFGGVGAVPAAAIGSAIGGLVGAVSGGFFGAEAGKKVSEVTIQDKLQKKFDAEKAEAAAASKTAVAAKASSPAAASSAPVASASAKPAEAAPRTAAASAANEEKYKSPSSGVIRQSSDTFAASAPKLSEHFREAHAGTVVTSPKPAVNDPSYTVAANNKAQPAARM